jgi:hypothetical protein
MDEERRRKYHFPGSGPYTATNEGDTGATADLRSTAAAFGKGATGNSIRLGVAMHVFADSYSQAGFTAYNNRSINERTKSWRPNTGHADADEGGHAPDYPYNDVGKALRAARGIYEVLPTAKCKTAMPWTEVEADLRRAFQVDSRYSSNFETRTVFRALGQTWAIVGRKPPTEEERINAIQAVITTRFGQSITYDKGLMEKYASFNDIYKRALGI